MLRFDVELVRCQGGHGAGRTERQSRTRLPRPVTLGAFSFGVGEVAAGLNQVDTTFEVTQVCRGGRICLIDQAVAVNIMPTYTRSLTSLR